MKHYEVTLEIKKYETFIVDADNLESAKESARCGAIYRGCEPEDVMSVTDIDEEIDNLKRSNQTSPVREEGETL